MERHIDGKRVNLRIRVTPNPEVRGAYMAPVQIVSLIGDDVPHLGSSRTRRLMNLCVVIPAAGGSRRFGREDKLRTTRRAAGPAARTVELFAKRTKWPDHRRRAAG